jgi:hypothetical protein
MINDPFAHYTARGSGGGVDTDPVNDADYIQCDYTFTPSTTAFTFAPITGDDDLVNLKFHIRKTLDSATFGSVITLIYKTSAGVSHDIGVLDQSSVPSNNVFTSSIDPSTSAAWNTANLAVGPVFGLKVVTNDILDTGIARFTRFYVEAAFAVGPTLGRDYREENWRFCDVCGMKHPYSRLLRPQPIHPQAGLVVCPRCYDQPDHDTIKAMSNSHPKDVIDPLY